MSKKDAIRSARVEFTRGMWSGKAHFQCDLCAYDCLEDEKRMLTHLVEVHASEAANAALFPTAKAEAPAKKKKDKPKSTLKEK